MFDNSYYVRTILYDLKNLCDLLVQNDVSLRYVFYARLAYELIKMLSNYIEKGEEE